MFVVAGVLITVIGTGDAELSIGKVFFLTKGEKGFTDTEFIVLGTDTCRPDYKNIAC